MLVPIGLCLIGAAPSQDPQQPLAGLPGYEEPAQPWKDMADAGKRLNCHETIEQVRDEAGLPRLDRDPARPDEAHHFYAVDREIDGCSVLVMAGDPADNRPLLPRGQPRMMPAR